MEMEARDALELSKSIVTGGTDPALSAELEANPKMREYLNDPWFVQSEDRAAADGRGRAARDAGRPEDVGGAGSAMGIDIVGREKQV
jgi:hypothetical protein